MEKDLIKRCKKGEPKAQRILYEQYKNKWFMVCLRYMKNREDALDMMQNGLIQIFSKIDQFDMEKGRFSGWSSRIIVNECIQFYRKKSRSLFTAELDVDYFLHSKNEEAIDRLSAEEITKMIQKLPNGYRIVFNLYAIEGFTHKEISKMLNVSIGTSKSQLFKAKKILQEKIAVTI